MSRTSNHGFTLVELMLAMGFVSALLLAIAMTVIQIGNIYNRGITFKNANQVGGSIANELQRGIANVNSFDVTPNGPNYIQKVESGRLCTGRYSYVWNYGRYIKSPGSNYIKYTSPDANTKIYFAKVSDPNSLVCTKVGTVYPDIVRSTAIELINAGQYDLAVHEFDITSYPDTMSDNTTGQQLYSIEFTMGTNDQLAFNAGTTDCSVSGTNANPTYCSVNKFNILARAGNKVRQAGDN